MDSITCELIILLRFIICNIYLLNFIYFIRIHDSYQSKKSEHSCNFWYKCSQNSSLTKKPRKIEDLSK